jgi:NADH-quinone oxidoreductase subunit H
VLTDLDGVRLLHGSDFAPSAPRWALLTLERGPLQKSNTLRVEVDGFHREPNADLLVGSILVGVMIALILMMIAPVSRVLTWGERQVARRLRELSPEARASREGAYRIPSEDADPWMARLLVSIAVGSALAAMAFGQPLVDVDLDLLVLWFSACVALISVSFLSGLVRRDGRWTLLGGLRRGGWVFLSQLPAAIATSCVATVAHGFSAQELVAAQGAAPWRWFAFHAPASPLLWLLFCASWMPDYVSHPGKHLARVLVAVEWGYLAVMGAVAATLFFGGWRLPFSTETTETTALKALGALVFILKAWGVSSAMLYARALLPRLQPGALLPVFFRWLGPIALVVMVITWASERWVHVGWVRSASEISGYIGVALALLVALAFARRVLLNLRSATSSQVRLSPWL